MSRPSTQRRSVFQTIACSVFERVISRIPPPQSAPKSAADDEDDEKPLLSILHQVKSESVDTNEDNNTTMPPKKKPAAKKAAPKKSSSSSVAASTRKAPVKGKVGAKKQDKPESNTSSKVGSRAVSEDVISIVSSTAPSSANNGKGKGKAAAKAKPAPKKGKAPSPKKSKAVAKVVTKKKKPTSAAAVSKKSAKKSNIPDSDEESGAADGDNESSPTEDEDDDEAVSSSVDEISTADSSEDDDENTSTTKKKKGKAAKKGSITPAKSTTPKPTTTAAKKKQPGGKVCQVCFLDITQWEFCGKTGSLHNTPIDDEDRPLVALAATATTAEIEEGEQASRSSTQMRRSAAISLPLRCSTTTSGAAVVVQDTTINSKTITTTSTRDMATSSTNGNTQPPTQQHDVQYYINMMKKDIPNRRGRDKYGVRVSDRASSSQEQMKAGPTGNSSLKHSNHFNSSSSSSFRKEVREAKTSRHNVSIACLGCNMVNDVLESKVETAHCFACGRKLNAQNKPQDDKPSLLSPSADRGPSSNNRGAKAQPPRTAAFQTHSRSTPPQQQQHTRSQRQHSSSTVQTPIQHHQVSIKVDEDGGADEVDLTRLQASTAIVSSKCNGCGLMNEGGSSCFACGKALPAPGPEAPRKLAKQLSPPPSQHRASSAPKKTTTTTGESVWGNSNMDIKLTRPEPSRVSHRPAASSANGPVSLQCGKCGLLNEATRNITPSACFACGEKLMPKTQPPANGDVVTATHARNTQPVAQKPNTAPFSTAASLVSSRQNRREDRPTPTPTSDASADVHCSVCGIRNEGPVDDSTSCFACGKPLVAAVGVKARMGSSTPSVSQPEDTLAASPDSLDHRRNGSRGRARHFRESFQRPSGSTTSKEQLPGDTPKPDPALDEIVHQQQRLTELPQPPPSCPSYFRQIFGGTRIMSKVKPKGSELRGRLDEEEEYEAWLYSLFRPTNAYNLDGYKVPFLNVARCVSPTTELRPLLGDQTGGIAVKGFLSQGGVLLDIENNNTSANDLVAKDEDGTQTTMSSSSDDVSGNTDQSKIDNVAVPEQLSYWNTQESDLLSAQTQGGSYQGSWGPSSYQQQPTADNTHSASMIAPAAVGSSPWGSTLTERLHQPGGILQKYVPESEYAMWNQHQQQNHGSASMMHHTVLSHQGDVCHALQYAISIPARTLELSWGWSKASTVATEVETTDTAVVDPLGAKEGEENAPNVVVGRVYSIAYLKPLRLLLRSITSGRADIIERHYHMLETRAFVARYRVNQVHAHNIQPKLKDTPRPPTSEESPDGEAVVYDTNQLALESLLSGKIGVSQLAAGIMGGIELVDVVANRWEAAVSKMVQKLIALDKIPNSGPAKWKFNQELDNMVQHRVQIANESLQTIPSRLGGDDMLPCPSTILLSDPTGQGANDLSSILRRAAKLSNKLPTLKYRKAVEGPTLLQLYTRYHSQSEASTEYEAVNGAKLQSPAPAPQTSELSDLPENVWGNDEQVTAADTTPHPVVPHAKDRCCNCRLWRDVFVSTSADGKADVCELCGQDQAEQPTHSLRSRRIQSEQNRQQQNRPSHQEYNIGGFTETQETNQHHPGFNTSSTTTTVNYNHDHYAEWRKHQQQNEEGDGSPVSWGGDSTAFEAVNAFGAADYSDEWAAIDQNNETSEKRDESSWGGIFQANQFNNQSQQSAHPPPPPVHAHKVRDAAPQHATVAPSKISYSGGKKDARPSSHPHVRHTVAPGTPTVARTKLGMALGSALGANGPLDILPPRVEW